MLKFEAKSRFSTGTKSDNIRTFEKLINTTSVEISNEIRAVNQLEFLFWPLVFTLIIIGLVRVRSPKNFFYLYKIVGNNMHLNLYLREGFNLNGISSYLLQFNYFVVFGTISYSIYNFYAKPLETDYLILLACYTAPLLYFLMKFVIIKTFSFLTETQQGFYEYLTNHKIFFQLQGLLLLPLGILLIFSSVEWQKYLVLIIIVLIVLFSVFRIALSILYAVRYGFSFLYILLYLCTLEILPLVVIFKSFSVKIVGES